MPYCPHCNRETFEIEEIDLTGTSYMCVQRSGCKAPLGLIEPARVEQSPDSFERRVTEVLRVIVSSLQAINSRLARIEQAIGSDR
jgi:hypothetical protein